MAFLCGSLRRKKKFSDSLSPLQPSQQPPRPPTRGAALCGDLQEPPSLAPASESEVQSTCSYATGSLISSTSGKTPAWACYWKANNKSATYRPSGERPRPPGGASRPHTQGGASRSRPLGAEEGFWWDTSADVGTPERQDGHSKLFSLNESSVWRSSSRSDPETRLGSLNKFRPNPYELLKELRDAKSQPDALDPCNIKSLRLQDLDSDDVTKSEAKPPSENNEPTKLTSDQYAAPNNPQKHTVITVPHALYAPSSQESILINSDYELTPEKTRSPSKRHPSRAKHRDDSFLSFESPKSLRQRCFTQIQSINNGQVDPRYLIEGQGHSHEVQGQCLEGQGHCYQGPLRQIDSHTGVQGHNVVQGQISCQGYETSHRPMTLTFGDLQSQRSSDDVILVSPVHPVPSELPGDDVIHPMKREVAIAKKPIGLAQGQLKLSVYVNHGLLTAHVIQGRNLRCGDGKIACNSFVKVNLIPDSVGRIPCVTEVIYDINNPTYDDKFSFEVSEEDQRRRLQVSVWNQSTMTDAEDQNRKDPKLLGCMSFGVKHLLSKRKADVCGWYYLLTEEAGRKKHLKVFTDNNAQGLDCIPKVNKALQGRDTQKAILNRGKSGYGFTLTGSSPVTVGRIESGSAAELAGLKQGDAVVSVNGKNVSRSTADSVAKIVKNAQSQLLIEFSRYRKHSIAESNKENVKESRNMKDYGSLKDYGSIDTFHFEENKFQARQKVRTSNHSVTVTKETVTHQHTVVRDAMMSPMKHTYQTMSPRQQRRMRYSYHSNGSLEESTTSSEESFGQKTAGDYSVEDHELTRTEQERQLAITDLMESEQHFTSRMQTGIAWYCRPLRHGVLSSQHHAKLFQNVEKLVALSEFHLKRLEAHGEIWCDGRNTGRVLDSVGVHYYPKILFLCEAYEQYSSGIRESLSLLEELRSFPEFQHFLSKTTSDERLPTMEEFLHLPLQHLNRMFQLLQETLTTTCPDHQDYQALHTVVQALSRTLFTVSHPEGQRKSNLALSACSLSSSESKSSIKSTTSLMSVDSEVLEIQSRLLFPSHVKSFKLAQPNRHFIFSSDIMWVENGKTWTRVVLLLFNDVILMTRAEKGGYHLVMDNPVYLNQVVNSVFNSAHPSEFQIICDGPGKKQRFVTFRSFSTEQKCTWKSLLEQRIKGSRSEVNIGQNICDLAIAL